MPRSAAVADAGVADNEVLGELSKRRKFIAERC
jgi:hypothetical protein